MKIVLLIESTKFAQKGIFKFSKLDETIFDFIDKSSWSHNFAKQLIITGEELLIIIINKIYLFTDNEIKQYILNQIELFKPRYLLSEKPKSLSINALKTIKENFNELRTICHYCAQVKNEDYILLNLYDHIIACSPAFVVEPFKGKTVLLYHSCPDEGFDIKYKFLAQKINRCSFFGSLISNIHEERKILITYLLKNNVPIDLYSSNYNSSKIYKIIQYLEKANFPARKLEKIQLKISKMRNPLFDNLNKPLYGKDMLISLSKYICTLNVHAKFAKKRSANMRLFEAASVGTCLITENFKNIKDLFIPDYEILTYSSKEECREKIKFCLDNPDKAYDIGMRARKRSIQNHRYIDRINQLKKELI